MGAERDDGDLERRGVTGERIEKTTSGCGWRLQPVATGDSMARATCSREKAAEPRETAVEKPVPKPGPMGGGSGWLVAQGGCWQTSMPVCVYPSALVGVQGSAPEHACAGVRYFAYTCVLVCSIVCVCVHWCPVFTHCCA